MCTPVSVQNYLLHLVIVSVQSYLFTLICPELFITLSYYICSGLFITLSYCIPLITCICSVWEGSFLLLCLGYNMGGTGHSREKEGTTCNNGTHAMSSSPSASQMRGPKGHCTPLVWQLYISFASRTCPPSLAFITCSQLTLTLTSFAFCCIIAHFALSR